LGYCAHDLLLYNKHLWIWKSDRLVVRENTMCGGIYEDELAEEFATEYTKQSKKKPMGDIKFMTAGDFMQEQDEYVYPGSDCQE